MTIDVVYIVCCIVVTAMHIFASLNFALRGKNPLGHPKSIHMIVAYAIMTVLSAWMIIKHITDGTYNMLDTMALFWIALLGLLLFLAFFGKYSELIRFLYFIFPQRFMFYIMFSELVSNIESSAVGTAALFLYEGYFCILISAYAIYYHVTPERDEDGESIFPMGGTWSFANIVSKLILVALTFLTLFGRESWGEAWPRSFEWQEAFGTCFILVSVTLVVCAIAYVAFRARKKAYPEGKADLYSLITFAIMSVAVTTPYALCVFGSLAESL